MRSDEVNIIKQYQKAESKRFRKKENDKAKLKARKEKQKALQKNKKCNREEGDSWVKKVRSMFFG